MSGHIKRAQTGSEDPRRRERKFCEISFKCNYIINSGTMEILAKRFRKIILHIIEVPLDSFNEWMSICEFWSEWSACAAYGLLTAFLIRAACVPCHGTKCPLLTFFLLLSFFLLSAWVTFLPEGVIVGFWNLACGFKSANKQILGDIFLKKWKVIRIIWNGKKIVQHCWPPLPDTCTKIAEGQACADPEA